VVENNFFFLFINKNYNLCGLSITKFIFVQILLQLMVTISLSTLANVLSIVVNLLLLLLKLIVGFIFNSISLVADGFDSVLDLVTAAFAGIGERISRKPADKSHPFGHQKFQFIFSFAIAFTLFFSSYFIADESISRLREGIQLEFSILVLIAALISFFGKLILALILYRIGNKLNSPVFIANAKNYRTDAFSSVFVIIAYVGVRFDIMWLDPASAFIIVGLIIFTGLDIIRNALPDLLDKGPPQEIIEQLKMVSLSFKEVKEVHIIRLRTLLGKYTGDFHILVNPELSIKEAHAVSERVKQKLEEEGDFTNLIIHIEPFTPEESLETKNMEID